MMRKKSRPQHHSRKMILMFGRKTRLLACYCQQKKTYSAKCEMHAKSYGRGNVIQFMCNTNILMILKESWKLRLTTSAQTMSSEKV